MPANPSADAQVVRYVLFVAHLTYERLMTAVQHESVSPSELYLMSEQLADSIHGLTLEESSEPIWRMLAEGAPETHVDLDVDLLLSGEVSKRANLFEKYESMRHIAEAIWRAKSRRSILDVAWELVHRDLLRPTANSTEMFDITQRGEAERDRWKAKHPRVE